MSAIDFQGNTIPIYDGGDAFVAKLTKSGQQTFFKLAGSNLNDYGSSITSFKCGAVAVGVLRKGITGTTGTIAPYDFNENPTNAGIYATRFDESGLQKFFKTGGASPESVKVGADQSGNIYIAGTMTFPTSDFNGQGLGPNGMMFVAKLDSCGKQLYFKTASNTAEFFQLGALNVDCEGNTYVTGGIDVINAVDFAGEPIITGLTGIAVFVAKLDKFGKQIYFKLACGAQVLNIYDITSKCGNVYVTGGIFSTGTDFAGNIIDSVNPNRMVLFIAKLNKCGHQKFFKIAGGAGSRGQAIKTHNKGVVVTGRLQPPYNDFNGVPQTGYGNNDIFVANLDNYGNQKFFKISGGADGDIGTNLDIDHKNNIYITGVLRQTNGYDFENNLVNTSGNSRIFVAKLNLCGDQKFYKIAGGTDGIFPFFTVSAGIGLVVDRCGCVYVTGQVTKNQNPIYDFENNQVVENFTDEDHVIFLSKLDKHGVQKFFKVAGKVQSGAGSTGYDIALGGDCVYITGTVGGQSPL